MTADGLRKPHQAIETMPILYMRGHGAIRLDIGQMRNALGQCIGRFQRLEKSVVSLLTIHVEAVVVGGNHCKTDARLRYDDTLRPIAQRGGQLMA